MNKILGILFFLAIIFNTANANQNSKFRIDELVILPHPGKVLKLHADEIGVIKEEQKRIKKEVQAVYAPLFQGKIREAFKIEKKVQRMVAKGKTKEDLKEKLDEIARLKRESINSRIDALNAIRKIVGEEKWLKIINFKINE